MDKTVRTSGYEPAEDGPPPSSAERFAACVQAVPAAQEADPPGDPAPQPQTPAPVKTACKLSLPAAREVDIPGNPAPQPQTPLPVKTASKPSKASRVSKVSKLSLVSRKAFAKNHAPRLHPTGPQPSLIGYESDIRKLLKKGYTAADIYHWLHEGRFESVSQRTVQRFVRTLRSSRRRGKKRDKA